MSFRVVPYIKGSASAKILASKLTEITSERVLVGRPSKKCINILWGNSNYEIDSIQSVDGISIAQNKLLTFLWLSKSKVSIPNFTTNKSLAEDLVKVGIKLLARQKLNSSQGRGIVVCDKLPIVDAPLYVKYIDKDKEFRVHVFNGEVLDLQEKRRRSHARDENGNKPNGIIRNLENNWVFCRNNIVEPDGIRELAIEAIKDIGLLFGAIDIIYNSTTKELFLLEVNTAPGLCDSTAIKYAKAFSELKIK